MAGKDFGSNEYLISLANGLKMLDGLFKLPAQVWTLEGMSLLVAIVWDSKDVI